MKKNFRPRQVPTLKEREKIRMAEKPKKDKKDKKPQGKILLFNPNAPQKLVAKDTIYYKYMESLKSFPLKKLAITFFIILIGGIGSAAFQARNTTIQTEINRAEREFRAYQTENFRLESQLQERYTHYEIERMATERLGMSFPDPSQVVNIYVPRIGGVTLNTDEYVLPRHNYFWQDMRNFLLGILNQIFGGS